MPSHKPKNMITLDYNSTMEEETTEQQSPPTTPNNRRKICTNGCDRPINVCLCDQIPETPISTNTHVVILQHPHELRQKLATVPILKKCLKNCEIIVGRKLRLGSSPILDSLYYGRNDSIEFTPFRHAVVLFPGTESMPSMEINEWRSSLNSACIDGCVLIVFDGTWKHAKEMVYASLPFLLNFATCVCFDCDYEVGGGSIYDSDVILKKEPFKGCMSTIEAVARALRVFEPSGVEIEAKLVEVLKSMVRLQACYLKPIKPRQKLSKKDMEQRSSIDATGDVFHLLEALKGIPERDHQCVLGLIGNLSFFVDDYNCSLKEIISALKEFQNDDRLDRCSRHNRCNTFSFSILDHFNQTLLL